MKAFGSILMAYILAAPLSANISLDLRQTEWLDLWTYIIWACSGLIWAAIVFAVVSLIAVASR